MARLIFRPEARESYLSALNPLSKLFSLLAVSAMISGTAGPASFLLLIILAAISYSAGIPLLKRLASVISILLIAALILVTDWLSYGDILASASSAASFISLFSAAVIFTGSTDMIDLASSLGRLLSPVAGKRAYALASNVMLVFALLPDIFQAAEEMLNARRSRGGRFFRHPVANLSGYTVSLMKRILSRSYAFSEALEARAYSESSERSAPPFTAKDGILIAAMGASAFIWIRLN